MWITVTIITLMLIDAKQMWDRILNEVELSTSKANFSTWFKNTYIVKIEDGVVYLGVPNEFVKDWLINKYHKFILKSLREQHEVIRSLEYTIIKDTTRREIFEKRPIIINKELPLNDLYINKEDNLNPKYTFDTFIIGSFNQLAHAAALSIVSKPGANYNPFFVYGGTGLGKTHLIQSIGNKIKANNSSNSVFYTSLEKFSMDYVSSMQNNKLNQFKEKYRKYDVLIMDDIQFIGTKERTQDELFHLFNALYESNKQIIFSSDKHPSFIPGLEDRLRSRFAAGMIVDISQPEYESRVAILQEKLKQNNISLPNEIIEYLASSIEGNIRELEGALNAVICQTELKGSYLSTQEVKSLIKNSVKPKKNMAVKDVVKVVANFYGIDEETIYEKTRKKEVVRPRQIAMYILREDFNISYPSIGEKLGGRDHTTVIHSYEKIKSDLGYNPVLNQEIEQIRVMFS